MGYVGQYTVLIYQFFLEFSCFFATIIDFLVAIMDFEIYIFSYFENAIPYLSNEPSLNV